MRLITRCAAHAAAAAFAILVVGCTGAEDNVVPSDNNPPVMAAVRDTTIALGDTVAFFVHATDPDGDDITYRLSVSMTWEELRDGYRADASLGSETGYFWFRPVKKDIPGRDFSFTADDGKGGESGVWMTVGVTNLKQPGDYDPPPGLSGAR